MMVPRFVVYLRVLALMASGLVGLPVPSVAQPSGMPQVRQMSGVPLPSRDVPVGTITVRVVREELANNLPDVEVQLSDGTQSKAARTDAEGRAQFTGVPAGTQVRAQVTMEGETVVSQSFAMPSDSGIRLVLALGVGAGTGGTGGASGSTGAGGPGAAGPGPVVQRGTVTLGGESRFVIEVTEGSVEVYCLLEVSNPAKAPVAPEAPLVFTLPEAAGGLSMLEGSIPGTTSGNTVSVPGPFPPGSSLLEFAYRLQLDSSRLTLTHVMPVALSQSAIVVRKLGNIDVSSPLIQQRRDVPMENRVYLLATGAGVAAGQPFTVEINGLPAHATWPRVTALALAGLVLLAGVGLDVSGHRTMTKLQSELTSAREQLLGGLVQLEKQRLAGKVAPTGYASRREALVKKLERVYAELEDIGALHRPAAGPGSRAAAI